MRLSDPLRCGKILKILEASYMQCFAMVLLACLCLSAFGVDADRERRKKEFLSKPIFVETVRKQEREAKEKAQFNPIPRRVEVPKELRQPPEPPSSIAQRSAINMRSPQSSVTALPSAARKPSNLPPPVAARTDGQCGWNKHVENYCYYREGNGWLLCTDRWGGCIQQEGR